MLGSASNVERNLRSFTQEWEAQEHSARSKRRAEEEKTQRKLKVLKYIQIALAVVTAACAGWLIFSVASNTMNGAEALDGLSGAGVFGVFVPLMLLEVARQVRVNYRADLRIKQRFTPPDTVAVEDFYEDKPQDKERFLADLWALCQYENVEAFRDVHVEHHNDSYRITFMGRRRGSDIEVPLETTGMKITSLR